MDNQTVREILDSVYRGQIRIPAFQRGFVWDPDRVAFLIDSIYKGYPFGSLLYWRTNEALQTERNLGPFTLPMPQADFPIDYVLDGQQRITSIFGVFQTELQRGQDEGWKDIYFDYTQAEDVQESQFVALSPEEVDPSKHFPLNCLFDTVEYRQKTRNFTDELAAKIDGMQSVFKEARIPVQSFRTDEKEKVAIIFERINRQGIPLDTLQLLSAWTWSEDFQLQNQFEDLIEELETYGFSELSDNISLLLRCSAAVLANSCQPESLVNLNGADVRSRFSEVVNGIKGALDFLRSELNVQSIDNLPYHYILVPLSTFFSVPGNREHNYSDAQRRTIVRWFWRVSFSQRYSHGTMRNLSQDIDEIGKLKNNQPNTLGYFAVNLTADRFKKEKFTLRTVTTSAFILMLAKSNPINFINGTNIGLDAKLRECNRKEFHHLMPKAFLRDSGQDIYNESCLANFCFISRADNRMLGGSRPSEYRQRMTGNVDAIIASHIIPESLFADDYQSFIDERSERLYEISTQLCA
ncbi:TPA: GmrSD restriction endonuclease domain-containing protein [Klebsiella pneumoniae]